MCNECAYLFFSLQTGDDGEHGKLAKKKEKRKRKSLSNDESDDDVERHRDRHRHRSKKKHSDRRDRDGDRDGDREDGELSEENECSDEMLPEKEKFRRRHDATDEKWQKTATIEILDSTESSMDSEQSFSNGKMQGNADCI